MRQKLGWPDDRFVVLHTGSLIKRKQPLEVLAAFLESNLSKNGLLAFAGDGSLVEQCMLAASGSRNISFLGHRSDLVELLGAADVVVSNSTSEGLPMALLEACACGLRVIASDIQPHRYIADLFPKQVSLFALGDNEALAELLNALAARGRENPMCPPAASLEMISAERASRLYQNLYDRVLSCTRTVMHNRFPMSDSQGDEARTE
jgi:glycosyltransferase involved in cell wall biosynthesis